MYIKKIEWLDKDEKEAILVVENNGRRLMCFSYPCFYDVGNVLTKPLECLDVDEIMVCNIKENSIEQLDGMFKYKLIGKLKNVQTGIVQVYDFYIHIDEDRIPNDAKNGVYIQMIIPRIDIW